MLSLDDSLAANRVPRSCIPSPHTRETTTRVVVFSRKPARTGSIFQPLFPAGLLHERRVCRLGRKRVGPKIHACFLRDGSVYAGLRLIGQVAFDGQSNTHARCAWVSNTWPYCKSNARCAHTDANPGSSASPQSAPRRHIRR